MTSPTKPVAPATQEQFTPANQPIAFAVAAIALLVGVWARFKGLGVAPLENDEYFILDSVGNVLKHGVPLYDCGGYYVRGLTLQYASAALQLLGATPELSTRLVTAVCSLLALPAAVLLGRRLGGRAVAALAFAWLAVSVWQVEIARFGRMYAPFHAVFLWYLVFLLRATLDRDPKAYRYMLLLTVLGTVTFEGGALLAATNFIPIALRIEERSSLAESLRRTIVASLLLGFSYWFVRHDWDGAAALPSTFSWSRLTPEPRPLAALDLSPAVMLSHPVLALLLAVPVVLTGVAGLRIWRRGEWLASLGLVAVLFAALGHQFVASISGLALLMLLGLVQPRGLTEKRFGSFWWALAASAAVWTVASVAIALDQHSGSTSLLRDLRSILPALAGEPAVLDYVFLPLVKAVPVMCVVLGALLCVCAWQVLRVRPVEVSATSLLLAVLLLTTLLVGSTNPPRIATRYVSFLYPVAVLLSVSVIAGWFSSIQAGRAVLLTLLSAFGAFAVTEDFQPRHLATIDSRATILREGLRPAFAAHLVARTDFAAIAKVLAAERAPGDRVVAVIPAFHYYYPDIDALFTDWSDERFVSRSCARGTVDRWTEKPLIYTKRDLAAFIRSSPETFVVLSDSDRDALVAATGWREEVVLSRERTSIVRFRPADVDPQR